MSRCLSQGSSSICLHVRTPGRLHVNLGGEKGPEDEQVVCTIAEASCGCHSRIFLCTDCEMTRRRVLVRVDASIYASTRQFTRRRVSEGLQQAGYVPETACHRFGSQACFDTQSCHISLADDWQDSHRGRGPQRLLGISHRRPRHMRVPLRSCAHRACQLWGEGDWHALGKSCMPSAILSDVGIRRMCGGGGGGGVPCVPPRFGKVACHERTPSSGSTFRRHCMCSRRRKGSKWPTSLPT